MAEYMIPAALVWGLAITLVVAVPDVPRGKVRLLCAVGGVLLSGVATVLLIAALETAQ